MYKTLKKALLPDYPRRVSVKKYFLLTFICNYAPRASVPSWGRYSTFKGSIKCMVVFLHRNIDQALFEKACEAWVVTYYL